MDRTKGAIATMAVRGHAPVDVSWHSQLTHRGVFGQIRTRVASRPWSELSPGGVLCRAVALSAPGEEMMKADAAIASKEVAKEGEITWVSRSWRPALRR